MGVSSPSEDEITITVTTNGEMRAVTMSKYNAWRTLGCLAVALGIPLSKEVGQAIKL